MNGWEEMMSISAGEAQEDLPKELWDYFTGAEAPSSIIPFQRYTSIKSRKETELSPVLSESFMMARVAIFGGFSPKAFS
jgi:hypothetical protein